MFFMFEQNNSGGIYVKGLPEQLFIEASTEAEATEIAKANGVDFEDFCSCCGNRWSMPLRGSSNEMSDKDIMEAILFALDNKITHSVIWK
jgi:hypothetical protein